MSHCIVIGPVGPGLTYDTDIITLHVRSLEEVLYTPDSLHDNPHKPGHFRVKYFTKRAKMAG